MKNNFVIIENDSEYTQIFNRLRPHLVKIHFTKNIHVKRDQDRIFHSGLMMIFDSNFTHIK